MFWKLEIGRAKTGRCWAALGLLAGWVTFVAVAGDAPVPTEYQIKAAFVYNFAKFVQWPRGTFANTDSPLILAVVGDESVSKDIDAINGRMVETHPVQVEWYAKGQRLSRLPACQILYILPTDRAMVESLVQRTRGTLTICNGIKDFAAVGADINLVKTPEGKIRFEINVDAARRAGLKIESPLLNLARIVREP